MDSIPSTDGVGDLGLDLAQPVEIILKQRENIEQKNLLNIIWTNNVLHWTNLKYLCFKSPKLRKEKTANFFCTNPSTAAPTTLRAAAIHE